MARSIRDLRLAFSLMAGPDGADGFSSSTLNHDAGLGFAPTRPLRVGWMVGPGLGPVDPAITAVVKEAAEALKALGCAVDSVRIPALEEDDAVQTFNRLHVMEMKPAFREATAGHSEAELYKMAKTMLSLPDTSIEDYIAAEQAVERLRDGYAQVFQGYDVLLTQVQPIPAHQHGLTELMVNGKKYDVTYLQGPTVPLNLTGLPGISMRFGTSKEGLPLNVQLIGSWNAESTILHGASLLESMSKVRDLHPPL